MKILVLCLSVLASIFVFTACEKKPVDVTGQIFVVTEGRENIKMGLVGVHVLTDEQFKSIAAKVVPQIKEGAIKDAAIKHLLSLESPDLPVPALEPLTYEIAAPERPTEWTFDRATGVFLSLLTSPNIKTDADGRFTIPVKSKVWLVAQGERSVGQTSESYLWMMPYELPQNGQPAPILVSNDSNVDSLDELYSLLATQAGTSPNLAEFSKAEIAPELLKRIESVEQKALVAVKEAKAQYEDDLKALAEKRMEILGEPLRRQGMEDRKIRELLVNGGNVFAWGQDLNDECNVPDGLRNVVAISASGCHSLALKKEGTVVAWGYNARGQCNVPSGLRDVVAISAGSSHNLALKKDGTVVAWGANGNDECNVPSGLRDVVAISASSSHNLALRKDGTVVAWGANGNDECNVPSGLRDVVAISAYLYRSVALTKDGTVVAWGENDDGECNVPSGLRDVVEVSTGFGHILALRKDGTVVAWGENDDGECDVPSDLRDVVAISAYGCYNLALGKDGTVVAWGDNDEGQCNVPSGLRDVVAIVADLNRSVALKKDGTVVAWGDNDDGVCNVPSGLRDVVVVSYGDDHAVAISLETSSQD